MSHRKNHWETPYGIAVRHDKKRARAEKLRAEAARLDAEADELSLMYEKAMAPHRARVAELLSKGGEHAS